MTKKQLQKALKSFKWIDGFVLKLRSYDACMLNERIAVEEIYELEDATCIIANIDDVICVQIKMHRSDTPRKPDYLTITNDISVWDDEKDDWDEETIYWYNYREDRLEVNDVNL